MLYLRREYLSEFVFSLIYENYTREEQVPLYEDDREGVEQLCGVLERIESDIYYPTLLDKATYLFLSINKGHFFGNGNKRLALVMATLFLRINDSPLNSDHTKQEHRTELEKAFPGFSDFEDRDEFFPEEYGLYNLSLVVADSEKYTDGDFDLLKAVVHGYFSFAIGK